MILTTEYMREKVPAMFAERHSMSDRYVQLPTYKMVETLAEAGYYPVDAGQTTPQRRNPLHVEHAITLRHENHLSADPSAGQVPQIILANSHNGRTKMRLFAGFYRFVCSNGLIVGDDLYRYEVAHLGDAYKEALGFADMMTNELDNLRGVIDMWSSVQLTNGQTHSFAKQAAEIRFGEHSAKSYQPESLLAVQRPEDKGNTLWQVFNRVQENTMRGGVVGENANRRVVRSRAMTAINPSIEYNSRLWNLASTYAEAA